MMMIDHDDDDDGGDDDVRCFNVILLLAISSTSYNIIYIM